MIAAAQAHPMPHQEPALQPEPAQPPEAVSAPATPREGRRRLRRVALGLLASTPVMVLALWIAVNRVEWLGPLVADGLRAVIGRDAVTWMEDFAYAQQDRFNRFWRKGEQPKAYWDVPAGSAGEGRAAAAVASAPIGDAAADGAEVARERLTPFAPADVGPVLKTWSAPGDGVWVPMIVTGQPEPEPYMAKTLLHPDKHRSWAEVFVVAIDMRRADIRLVAGSKEPVATTDEAKEIERPGKIPTEHRDTVLAAFNGGFKTEHGEYGMFLDGVTLVPPKDKVCTVAAHADGFIEVRTWTKLERPADEALWWRQTPNCMYEDGKLHPRLESEELAKKWGATLDGETVIRRSAIGVSADGNTLYVAISNNTTARVIAEGLVHAGATSVAQLDVNFSYPKFVTFEPKAELAEAEEPKRIAIALADGFEFSEDEYIRKKTRRDFFYVMPKGSATER